MTTNNDRGVTFGVLAIALSIVALFAIMTVTARVLSPGDDFPVTAQLNSF
jgi:hypothetical protein